MDFRVLGPLEVVEHGRRLPVSGAKQRCLLAVLCLHANEAVSSDRLIDALWGEEPPERAQAALQYHVSQLRKLLGRDRIETSPPGYRLRLSPDELDLTYFERLVREGNYADALALWRGPALADFQYTDFAQAEIARLEELRLAALEERIEQDLARGRHAEVIGELEALVREQPLRERPCGQLMLALYQSGRQAEALALYKETRRTLVEELGLEPGRELQELERRILNRDPALAPPPLEEEVAEEAPPAAPREERKVVTALFCDLVGFTARAESLDPEDVGALLTPFYVRLRADLERHGGTVEKFVGDAVMAVFGAPVAHEDDPERAVRAALAIRDWISEQREGLQVRIGINTGEALVRLEARPDAGQGMAVGDVVNTAARLQQATPPGAIVVGDATYRLTKEVIAYEQLDAIEVKGKEKPVPRWLATEALSRVAGAPPLAAPFIGRENDLALLTQTYARVLRESSLQLVTVVGEPGIGKTRLVGEFHGFVQDQPDDVLWRQGRCLSYGEGITFWALGEIVKGHAGILDSDAPEAAAGKLAAAVSAVVAESERDWVENELRPLVGAAGDGRMQATERSEVFAAWRMFFEGAAAQHPLVLVIEDLHWADDALLEFVEHLVEWSTDVPLLLVCTARPELFERKPAWGGGKRNAATVSLAPLSEEETARLVGTLLVEAALPAETQAQLLDRAGGNPLFAEEFVRMLRDQGLLGTEVDVSVPETVQAVIAARLDTLAADRKELLHNAAAVGKVFWAGALAAMGHVPNEAVLEGLHELGRKELVRRSRSSSFADDVEYLFWHVLVRDVAYSQIPRAERARRHVAAAQWIERRAERPADVAELLAHHYATALELARAAGDTDQAEALDKQAVRYLVEAGDRAIRFDPAQGERYYRRALELLTEDDARLPRVLAEAADAGTKAGRSFEQIRAEFEEAIARLRAQGDVFAAANALQQLGFSMFGRPESFAAVEEALRLLEGKPPGRELALVYARFAQLNSLVGRTREALAWSEKALPLLERFGLDDEALMARSRLVSFPRYLGDFPALDEMRELAGEAVDPERGYGTFAVCVVLNNLAFAEVWFGAGPAAAAEYMRAAVDLATRRGLERPARWYRANLSETLYDLGEWDEALRIAEEAAEWERVGILAEPPAAMILAARGQLAAAAALIEDLLLRARELEGPTMLASALLAAAVVEAAGDESASAVARLEAFEELMPEAASFLGYLGVIGRICAQAGQLAVLERLLDAASDLGPRLDRFVSGGLAILAEAKGEHDRAESLYARAEQGLNDHGCLVERAHALVGLGRCRLALGRSAEAQPPLRAAREIFERLEAHPLVAEADELLGRTVAAGA